MELITLGIILVLIIIAINQNINYNMEKTKYSILKKSYDRCIEHLENTLRERDKFEQNLEDAKTFKTMYYILLGEFMKNEKHPDLSDIYTQYELELIKENDALIR